MNPSMQPIGTCRECGKLCWTSKKNAKSAAKREHPSERLAVYRCGQWWHYGHLTRAIQRGIAQRGSY